MSYNFSFTGSTLALANTVRIANMVNNVGWDSLKGNFERKELLSKETQRRAKRELSEIRKRLKNLTHSQLTILVYGDLLSQMQIAFLGVCKSYDLIKDFMLEVARPKFLMFDHQLSDSDFISFWRNKEVSHPEVEQTSDSTREKIRRNLYTIMAQGGILDSGKSRVMVPQFMTDETRMEICEDNPEWLKMFLFSDRDLKTMCS